MAAIRLNCLEPLSAIGCAIGAVSLHALDAGLTAGAVVGGVGLFARLRENMRKAGLEAPALMQKMQRAVIRDEDTWDQTQEDRDALALADAAMTRWLPDVMLTREELAQSAAQKAGMPYPRYAAALVADRLAEKDSLFAAGAAGSDEPLARRFARTVVERALSVALDDPDYRSRISVDFLIGMAGKLADIEAQNVETHAKLKSIEEQTAETRAALVGYEGKIDEVMQAIGKLSIPDRAVREAIARFIAVEPDASTLEIIEAVSRFEADYRKLAAQVAELKVLDNRVTSLKGQASDALEAGDLDTARQRYAEAADAALDKAAEPVRTATQLLATQAKLHLLALDWRSAQRAWRDAELLIRLFDHDESRDIAIDAAEQLNDFAVSHGNADIFPVIIKQLRQTIEFDIESIGGPTIGCSILLGTLLTNLAANTYAGEEFGAEAKRLLERVAAALAHDESPNARRAAGMVNLQLARRLMTEANEESSLYLARQGRDAIDIAMANLPTGTLLWHNAAVLSAHIQAIEAEVRGKEDGAAMLADAIVRLHAALQVMAEAEIPANVAQLWPLAEIGGHQLLADALRLEGEWIGGPEGAKRVEEAIAILERSLETISSGDYGSHRTRMLLILGEAFETAGEQLPLEQGRKARARAIEIYRTVQSTATADASDGHWRSARYLLAWALYEHGKSGDTDQRIAALRESLELHEYLTDLPASAIKERPLASAMARLVACFADLAALGVDPEANVRQARYYARRGVEDFGAWFRSWLDEDLRQLTGPDN